MVVLQQPSDQMILAPGHRKAVGLATCLQLADSQCVQVHVELPRRVAPAGAGHGMAPLRLAASTP
eukprot:scaffold17819_cov120-Isochrysis_galbana.AAC.1